MKSVTMIALLVGQATAIACGRGARISEREPAAWSGWIEEAAARRGYIKPGDFAQFGCPSGWMGVDDTAAALRGGQVSTTYMGTEPPPREGTLTCVAQKEFALPPRYARQHPDTDPGRRPLAPVSVDIEADRMTISFRSEVPRSAAIYIGEGTPCGPRVIGVRLGDLFKWLNDPHSATTRDFLGMVSAGCPDPRTP